MTPVCNNALPGCTIRIQDTITLLTDMGFCINENKSVLVPTKHTEYLGNIIDTDSMKILLPECRVETLVKGCKELMCKRENRIREVAQVIGLQVAAIPAAEVGKLHKRQ